MTRDALRKQAEIRISSGVRLRKCVPPPPDPAGDAAARELEVHRVELELQNEELERCRALTEAVRARYVDLFEAAPIPYVTLDDVGRILDANRAAAAWLGTDVGTLLRKPLSVFLPPRDADAFYVFRQDVLSHGSRRSCELSVRVRGGEVRRVAVFASAAVNGPTRECRCAFFDMSEVREREGEDDADVQHGRRMQTVGQLTDGLVHELGNVLQAVVSCSALAADDTISVEQARGFMEHAKAMALRGAGVVGRLNGFARREPEPARPVVFDDVLRRAESLLRPLLGEHIELRIEPGAHRALVFASPVDLEHVLLDVIASRRGAMPTGGSLVISTESTSQDDGARAVVLRALDTGDRTPSGLAAVRAIASRLGGRVEVEAGPSGGTAVAVVLPACEPPREEARSSTPSSPPPPPNAATRRPVVLLVEDEEPSRRAMTRLLEDSGLSVLEASSLAEARTLAAIHRIDVLLTDMRLPDGRGDELAEELKKRATSASVVYMSGTPLSATRVPGIYLEKPIDIEELVARIQDLARPLPTRDGGPESAGGRASAPPSAGSTVIVRRRQGNGTLSEFVLRAASQNEMRRGLRSLLQTAGAERGLGIWSDADPEVWVGNVLIGRLTPRTDITTLLDLVSGSFS